jgi:hypothetical protein
MNNLSIWSQALDVQALTISCLPWWEDQEVLLLVVPTDFSMQTGARHMWTLAASALQVTAPFGCWCSQLSTTLGAGLGCSLKLLVQKVKEEDSGGSIVVRASPHCSFSRNLLKFSLMMLYENKFIHHFRYGMFTSITKSNELWFYQLTFTLLGLPLVATGWVSLI